MHSTWNSLRRVGSSFLLFSQALEGHQASALQPLSNQSKIDQGIWQRISLFHNSFILPEQTMKLAQALVLLLSQLDSSSAWLATPVTRAKLTTKLSAHSPADFLNDENNNLDAILSEGPMTSQNQVSQQSTYKVALPVVKSGDNDQSTIILASAATATIAEESSTTAATTVDGEASTTADSEADPYASAFDSQMEKMQMYTERVEEASKSNSVGDRLKNMDLQDIISTLIVPSIAVFAAGRWAFNRVSSRVSENTDAVLDSFAREMIYHDGDFDEMKLCFQDYSRKLVVLGLSKTDTMLKTYLEAYAKKKTVSPQAIVSLSYALTLAKLSEAKAAELFVSLCRKMGPEKIASSGKLLFLGNRILKSPEGRQALEPIKDMIKATYRDEEVAETLVETSQK